MIVAEWNLERDNYVAQNQILPFTTLSINDIDHKYKFMIVMKLDELQDQAIRQLMNDLPRVLGKFPMN